MTKARQGDGHGRRRDSTPGPAGDDENSLVGHRRVASNSRRMFIQHVLKANDLHLFLFVQTQASVRSTAKNNQLIRDAEEFF
jgi:hypothetical protein